MIGEGILQALYEYLGRCRGDGGIEHRQTQWLPQRLDYFIGLALLIEQLIYRDIGLYDGVRRNQRETHFQTTPSIVCTEAPGGCQAEYHMQRGREARECDPGVWMTRCPYLKF